MYYFLVKFSDLTHIMFSFKMQNTDTVVIRT